MSTGHNAPVIIKRKKIVGGDGHHGGAWKVAYADFVTAMMAFFMLMWLLNATTEKQRKGIADYFNPTIPVNRISGGGEGVFGGTNILAEDTLVLDGTGASLRDPADQDKARGDTGLDAEGAAIAQSDGDLEEIEEQFLSYTGESLFADELLPHIVTRVTDEGLIVEVFDVPGRPLFVGHTVEPTPTFRLIAGIVAETFAIVANPVAIGAHSRAQPVVVADNPVWELTVARSLQTRRLLQERRFDAGRIHRVTGFADRILAHTNPLNARNNRVEFVLLREED